MEQFSSRAQDSQSRIRRAQSDQDVVQAVLAYVEELSDDRLSRLPDACRPDALHGRDDIVAFNVELARKELVFDGSAADARLLREMLSVMTEAASRFAQLAARNPPPPS